MTYHKIASNIEKCLYLFFVFFVFMYLCFLHFLFYDLPQDCPKHQRGAYTLRKSLQRPL